jgi:uncharacterized protein (DUF1330 family)
MGRFDSYVITWGDEGPLPAGQAGSLAAAAGAHGGELLALGPVHDCSERDSRPVPAWVAIAGFGDEAAATAWFGQAAEQLGPATVLAPALTEPVWWPPDLEPWRPGWSRSLEVPRARLGLFVTIWAELTDPPQFLDYASKFKWTVEHDGGVVLAGAPFPRVLAGGSGPHAIALFGWPADEAARHTWYDGARYHPYKQQRHRSADCTIVSVMALGSRSDG